MTPLPKQYTWIDSEPGPRLLKEMRALYGTIEVAGRDSNPTILGWAKSIGLGSSYKNDEIPWCGLAMAYAAAQAGWDHSPRGNALYARNWLFWGNPVAKGEEMLGDVLVFSRGPTQGHVALYVGEDETSFHIMGGNQGDAVSIRLKTKALLIGARRCPWRVNQPANVRKILMSTKGPISTNEA